MLIPRSNLSIVGIPLRPRIFPASSPPPQPTRTTPTLNLHPSFATSSTAATPYHTTANLESQIRSRTATSLSQTFSTQLYQAEQNLAHVPTFDLEQRVRLKTEVKILKVSFEVSAFRVRDRVRVRVRVWVHEEKLALSHREKKD